MRQQFRANKKSPGASEVARTRPMHVNIGELRSRKLDSCADPPGPRAHPDDDAGDYNTAAAAAHQRDDEITATRRAS